MWTAVLVHRSAVTWDFSAYNQAAWLIAHGHLNPYSTLLGKPFWKNDGEFIIWPLALFVRIWPSLLTLPLLQDVALVAGEAVALGWICDIAARHAHRNRTTSIPVALVALGILLLVGNPWLIWTVSFDVHMEPFIALFAIAAARDFQRGRRSAWIWLALGLTCGSVGAGYMGAIGVSAVLSGRWLLRRGLLVITVGFTLLLCLALVHATPARVLDLYGPVVTGNASLPTDGVTPTTLIKAVFEHPANLLNALWFHKTDIWANLSPGGVLGLLWLPVTVPILLILGEGGLGQSVLLGFSAPGFQNVAIVSMIAVGTVAVLTALASRVARRGGRGRWLLFAAMTAIVANTIMWSIVWLPNVSRNWLLVSPAAASTLHRLEAKIPTGDEVIVSQGVAGTFADRKSLYSILAASFAIPVDTRSVWIIFTPSQGVEEAETSGLDSDIEELEADHSMRLVTAVNGVWAFRWIAPRGTRILTLSPSAQEKAAGSTIVGASGVAVREGPPAEWYSIGTAKPGYVTNGDYLLAFPGRYQATVTLSVTRQANVELWDSTTSDLLTRRVVRETHGKQTVRLRGRLLHTVGQPAIGGYSIWSTTPQRVPGDALEVRVWSPGGKNRVKVYSTALQQLSGQRYNPALLMPQVQIGASGNS